MRRIAITGGSSGLGAGLARGLAAPGIELWLCARNSAGLAAVAADCEAAGASVRTRTIDLRDRASALGFIGEVLDAGPLDLLILNAGIFAGRAVAGGAEPEELLDDLIATNLVAPMRIAGLAAQAMRARGAGRIVLVSSLAAAGPLPDAQVYSATKAGLSAFGKALADDLAGSGVGVTLVEPGHVRTRQTEQHAGATTGALDVEEAVARILAAIARGQTRFAFPIVPRLWVAASDAMPRWLRLRLNRGLRFTVANDPQAKGGGNAGRGAS